MSLTLAETMALAVLKGDMVAAYALADKLAEQRATDPVAREIEYAATRESGHVDGFTVYHWPEFEAFCKRLGVMWDLLTIELSITLRENEPPQIRQEYRGRDNDFHPGVAQPQAAPEEESSQ